MKKYLENHLIEAKETDYRGIRFGLILSLDQMAVEQVVLNNVKLSSLSIIWQPRGVEVSETVYFVGCNQTLFHGLLRIWLDKGSFSKTTFTCSETTSKSRTRFLGEQSEKFSSSINNNNNNNLLQCKIWYIPKIHDYPKESKHRNKCRLYA